MADKPEQYSVFTIILTFGFLFVTYPLWKWPVVIAGAIIATTWHSWGWIQ